MRSILAWLASVFGYIAPAAPTPTLAVDEVMVYAEPKFEELPNGMVIFPFATDANGKPMKFERGVSYIVGSNGRWRKKRETKSFLKTAPKYDREKVSVPRAKPIVKSPPIASTPDRRLHVHYLSMMAACYDPSHHRYATEGAAGATVCERWKNDFPTFLKDVMPADGVLPRAFKISRVDMGKPFEPGNIDFVGVKAGTSNRKRRLTDDDVRHIRVSDQSHNGLGKIYGVGAMTISQIRSGRIYTDVI